MEAEAAVRAHPECQAIFFCWPPFKDDCAFRALRTFAGDRLVYAGDVRFTAEARFHALLASDWALEAQLPLPSWPGIEDALYLYLRRP
jgi:hypothetical protein